MIEKTFVLVIEKICQQQNSKLKTCFKQFDNN